MTVIYSKNVLADELWASTLRSHLGVCQLRLPLLQSGRCVRHSHLSDRGQGTGQGRSPRRADLLTIQSFKRETNITVEHTFLVIY